MPYGSAPRIFLNYRRDDTQACAEHLYASLASRYGIENVFRDEATIKYGEDFPSEIERAVISSDVVLVLIGRKWLTVRGKDGRRRLDAPGDYVRKEIETALSQGLDVIPVLVDGAVIPSRRELPKSIIPLLTRNACARTASL